MRILALSDIHRNISAVRQLRSREINAFDAIVLAGDIGNESAVEILGILRSFGCPVLYVYGNWDHTLEYDQSFGTRCEHLHLRSFQCGQYSFAGFSGLPTHWGRNPIAASVRHEIAQKHQAAVNRYAECEGAAEAAILRIEAEHNAQVAELASKTKDRRKAAYLTKLKKTEDKRDRRIEKCRLPLQEVSDSQEYRTYRNEIHQSRATIAKLNRRALVQVIMTSPASLNRTIVVTHERLYRTWDDLPGLPLFLFGHKHGFANTVFQGSRFVNVSTLDCGVTVYPAQTERPLSDDYRNINAGNYVVIEAKKLREFDVRCVSFNPSFEGWKHVGNGRLVGIPWVE